MIKATKTQIQDFKESLLWQDILEELKGWAERGMQELDSLADHAIDENLSSAKVLIGLGDINGRRKAFLYFSDILDTLLSMKEGEKNDSGCE